jgi:hypothetical protein
MNVNNFDYPVMQNDTYLNNIVNGSTNLHYKTQMCVSFVKKSICKNYMNCLYAHSLHELETVKDYKIKYINDTYIVEKHKINQLQTNIHKQNISKRNDDNGLTYNQLYIPSNNIYAQNISKRNDNNGLSYNQLYIPSNNIYTQNISKSNANHLNPNSLLLNTETSYNINKRKIDEILNTETCYNINKKKIKKLEDENKNDNDDNANDDINDSG